MQPSIHAAIRPARAFLIASVSLLATALAPAQEPPADPAASPEQIVKSVSVIERWQQGGATMIFLALLSVTAVTFAIERAARLRRPTIFPEGLSARCRELWKQGDFEGIRRACAEAPSTLAAIIETFVRHRKCQPLELSALAADLAGRDLRGHLARAYPLAVVATLAPLLGLLGTVIGMVEAFEVVAVAGSLGDASLLAGSISKALITTAAGLIIAVPALGLYHYFRGKTNTFAMALEGEVNDLLATWFFEKADQE